MAFRCDRRLYLSQDKSQVVEEKDPSAAFLFATPGVELSDVEAACYGLGFENDKITLPKTESVEKAQERTEDKSAKRAEDKGRKKRGTVSE